MRQEELFEVVRFFSTDWLSVGRRECFCSFNLCVCVKCGFEVCSDILSRCPLSGRERSHIWPKKTCVPVSTAVDVNAAVTVGL